MILNLFLISFALENIEPGVIKTPFIDQSNEIIEEENNCKIFKDEIKRVKELKCIIDSINQSIDNEDIKKEFGNELMKYPILLFDIKNNISLCFNIVNEVVLNNIKSFSQKDKQIEINSGNFKTMKNIIIKIPEVDEELKEKIRSLNENDKKIVLELEKSESDKLRNDVFEFINTIKREACLFITVLKEFIVSYSKLENSLLKNSNCLEKFKNPFKSELKDCFIVFSFKEKIRDLKNLINYCSLIEKQELHFNIFSACYSSEDKKEISNVINACFTDKYLSDFIKEFEEKYSEFLKFPKIIDDETKNNISTNKNCKIEIRKKALQAKIILIELYEIIIEIFKSICIKNNIKEFGNFLKRKMSEFSPENIEEMQDFII
ncbi:hypothetical protein HERIO_1753 [Hepatospora eriocheir]|uniref:Uncharacterized protein n=1 Tax=Hepatospora eriocheir TaxID=1081669 RepID=A0A1X0Q9C4_9MICR|nr:hypothetical protein HERIO_1753 [Hepatospora eriocheir]